MADLDEETVLLALAARVARIDGTGAYQTDLSASLDADDLGPVQRYDLDSLLDEMPLVSTCLQNGDFVDQGVTPRYAAELGRFELIGCLRRGADRLESVRLLKDMKIAALDPITGDAITQCAVMRVDGFQIFPSISGELFTQVSLYLTIRWDDDTVGDYD